MAHRAPVRPDHGYHHVLERLGAAAMTAVAGPQRLPFLRQAMCLGGGSNEIQRNIISERILGLPREWAADREIPYRDVTRTSASSAPAGPGARGPTTPTDTRGEHPR